MNSDITLIVQALPPVQDAIGAYTASLAEELGRRRSVKVLTAFGTEAESIPGVRINQCFSLNGRGRFKSLLEVLDCGTEQAVILQYNPFAWGRLGFAPDLIRMVKRLKVKRPELTLSVMVHETFVPENISFKFRIMNLWQKRQYFKLLNCSDVTFVSIEAWTRDEIRRRPQSKVVHLPVGSSIPVSNACRSSLRARYGITDSDLLFCVFGGAHPSKLFDWVGKAVKRVQEKLSGRNVAVLHVGGDGERVKEAIGLECVVSTGWLTPLEAANALASSDMMLTPFLDGISTRRSSVMSSLSQGTAVASTIGHNTDSVWREKEASGIFLSPAGNESSFVEMVERTCLQAKQLIVRNGAKDLYNQTFSWPKVAEQLLDAVEISN